MARVIAHRGARSLAPENTLAAAQLAFDTGADLWETDIHQTRDGHLILFHDDTLLRCTTVQSQFPSRARELIDTFLLDEIQMLDAGSYFEKTDPFGQIACGAVSEKQLISYRKEHVPTLEQGLAFTKNNNWTVNLELKAVQGQKTDNHLPRKILEAIGRTGLSRDQVVISSFYHPWLEWISENQPQIEVQALVGDDDNDPLDFEDFRFATYNVNAYIVTKEQIADLKARGKTVNLFTVNDKKMFDTFCKMGVDGIFTDFPQWFVTPVKQKNP